MKRVLFVVLMTVLVLGSSAAYAQTSDVPPPGDTGRAARGYAYPIAWLLPLALLIATAAVGRALTRDVRGTGRSHKPVDRSTAS